MIYVCSGFVGFMRAVDLGVLFVPWIRGIYLSRGFGGFIRALDLGDLFV